MSFRAIFIAVVATTILLAGALIINHQRPVEIVGQPNSKLVEASGKCAECHQRETPAMVHEYSMSRHAAKHITCLDCHQALEGQEQLDHRGYVIAKHLTASNCRQCHETQYQQYLRSRHAAPAWAAVRGTNDFTAEQVAYSEQYHAGAVARPANALATLEGQAAMTRGCQQCHSIGKPNMDGSLGTCTVCHSRHNASVELARLPSTCGQCHVGPDHSQIEIYEESKHGILFTQQRYHMNLSASPDKLTTDDMPVPTCATCHMSGLNGKGVTHDTSERLSYWLFAAVSKKRPNYLQGQNEMKELCTQCHTKGPIDQYYNEAEQVVGDVNDIVKEAKDIMDGLYADGLLTKAPFDESIEYFYFDLWHYYGRTAKHGAFMGGADFVQWHGFYELVRHLTELKEMAAEIRTEHAVDAGQ